MRTEPFSGRRQKFSLQARMLTSISVFISVVFVAVVTVAMYFIHVDRIEDLNSRAAFLADLQSAGLARPIWDFEFAQATSMLQTLSQDPDFRYAQIEDAKGKQIGAAGEPPVEAKGHVVVKRDIIHRDDLAEDLAESRKQIGTLTLVLSEKRLRDALMPMVVGGAVLLVIILFLVIRGVVGTLRIMTKPLAGIARAMERIAAGDHSTNVPALERADEIGDMARAVQVFKDNSRKVVDLGEEKTLDQARQEERVQKVQTLSKDFDETVGDSLDVVATQSFELQATAQTMVSAAEQSAEQSKAMADMSGHIDDMIQTLASASEELSTSVGRISEQVVESTTTARDAVEQANSVTVIVEGLSEEAQKIGEIVSLINGIAGQTNLLALNATIEAARAGEAGKGFAVVAAEVKSLANETARATSDIDARIKGIQDATQGTVDAIRGIRDTVDRIGERSLAISSAIEEQNASTFEIARSAQEVAKGTRDVSGRIGDVDRAASVTGASATQVLDASKELSKLSETLRGRVKRFLTEVRTA